ncbi:MAG TPA: hypothetical protein VED22_01830 [Nitrososphaerales archaeon]|nr:hypothetical protein [Nitrososphaerales archaeon]
MAWRGVSSMTAAVSRSLPGANFTLSHPQILRILNEEDALVDPSPLASAPTLSTEPKPNESFVGRK